MERQIERRNAAQYQKELSSVLYSRVYSATAATSAAAAAATSAVSPAAAIEDSAVAPEASASQANSFAKIVQHGPPTPSWAPSPSSPSTMAWPTLSSRAKKTPSTPPSTAPAWGAPAPQTPLSPSTPAGHSSGRGGGRRKKNKK